MSEKVIVVRQATRLTALVERFNTAAQARFYLEHMGQDFGEYEREHSTYEAAVAQVCREVEAVVAKVQTVDRSYLPNFLFAPGDLVVTVGRDGLVVNTAKYLSGQPLVAVNPDPRRWDGVLLPYSPSTVGRGLAKALSDRAAFHEVTMAEATFNDGQRLLAFNDFMIGLRGHASARYGLSWRGRKEEQSSSGVLVSTGAGSTGWFQSTQTMAGAVCHLILGDRAPHLTPLHFAWGEKRLVFVVREPFPSRSSGVDLSAGWIDEGETLEIESRIPEEGVVFSDGMESDAVSFNAGTTVRIGVSDRRVRLVAA